ncbi:hypothetical protein TcWFU_002553 [Taenia crassiceps]|uniref:Secreted protein n=1 Tax=Taenia crassiceps TaxID=6207 RepID=A0ABR4QPG9_9CEST
MQRTLLVAQLIRIVLFYASSSGQTDAPNSVCSPLLTSPPLPSSPLPSPALPSLLSLSLSLSLPHSHFPTICSLSQVMLECVEELMRSTGRGSVGGAW